METLKNNFVPRLFEAIVDEVSLEDGGTASFTFEVRSLTKGKIYKERNPEYLQGCTKDVVIDDNSCWWKIGSKSFNERFKEVKKED